MAGGLPAEPEVPSPEAHDSKTFKHNRACFAPNSHPHKSGVEIVAFIFVSALGAARRPPVASPGFWESSLIPTPAKHHVPPMAAAKPRTAEACVTESSVSVLASVLLPDTSGAAIASTAAVTSRRGVATPAASAASSNAPADARHATRRDFLFSGRNKAPLVHARSARSTSASAGAPATSAAAAAAGNARAAAVAAFSVELLLFPSFSFLFSSLEEATPRSSKRVSTPRTAKVCCPLLIFSSLLSSSPNESMSSATPPRSAASAATAARTNPTANPPAAAAFLSKENLFLSSV
mmetsp:Transcript_2248/g.8629  ORF Transcript_2248/g.8629 Transcript_2248/m.8629 type:complete len:293 (+) Transcript_2248:1632-2510(+)